jgi:hypothetical protein
VSIEAFQDILLEDTYVFSWRHGADSLTFEILASLLQSHPEASQPAEGDWACYRQGRIAFTGVSSVVGLLPQGSVPPATDADGSTDFGCIDELSLVSPGEYRISGEFGVVTVAARDVSLVLAARPN